MRSTVLVSLVAVSSVTVLVSPHLSLQLEIFFADFRSLGQIKGSLATWRYEFLIVGAVCSFWAICLALYLPNSPVSFRGFSRDERVLMIARMRKNQTGIESKTIKWDQIVEAVTDYKTYMFFLLGLLGMFSPSLTMELRN